MKRMKRPWLQLVLVLTLLGGLLPIGTASAAAQISITSLFVASTLSNGRPLPADEPNITKVTSETIDLLATVQGITDEQLTLLYLEVTNMNTGISDEITSIVPLRRGTYDIEFSDVPLTEGLNKVVIKMSGSTTTESAPGWVYSTPVTNITNLKVNEEDFREDRFYPSDPGQSTIVNISGNAFNATEVEASLYGGTGAVSGYLNDGEFFFVGDDATEGTQTANLFLNPGDNLITFFAHNNARTFQIQRNLIYDNGGPFAFDLEIYDENAPATPDPERLILNPIIVDNTVTLSGLLKVNVENDELEFNTVEITLPGNVTQEYTIDLDPGLSDLTESVTWSVYDEYAVFEFEEDFTLGSTSRTQTVDIEFSHTELTTETVESSFYFYYENPTLPYIDHVELLNGSSSLRISETGRTEISEQPARFYVYANTNTDSITATVGSGGTVTVAGPTAVNGFNRFTVTISGVVIGQTDIEFIPVDGVTSNADGAKTYDLTISSAPYVILQNIYNGMIVEEADDLTSIKARFVNIDDPEQVEIVINDVAEVVDPDNVSSNILTHPLDADQLEEGQNVIQFIVYEDDSRDEVVSETTVSVFLFTEDAPEFLSLEPVDDSDEDKYRETNVDGTYVTNETHVVIRGEFAFVNDDEDVSLVVTNTPDPLADYFDVINIADGEFETEAIELAESGDTTFRFSITNDTNVVVTRTITITREPVPYVIVSPKVRINSDGIFQGNINSNFVEFEIEAENADAVLFDDVPAIERTVEDPDTGLDEVHFFHEVRGLRNGRNNIEFTVVRGEEEIEAEVLVFNVNTPVEGATFKSTIRNKISAFNNQLELTFPRNTNLQRNDASAVNQFITTERQVLFGIADSYDGRVDKYKHPASYDGQVGNPNPLITSTGRLRLAEPARFSAVSPLFWIDAGTIEEDETDLDEALAGSGRLPYDEDVFYAREQEDLVVPTQPGTLTLQYDPRIRSDAWKYVTVFHFDIYEDYRGVVDWRWRNIGGVVDPDENTITVPLERFGYYQVMYMDQSFDDVISHEWARDYLDIMYAKGLMLNKSNSNFVPNESISRGEFVTLLVKIFQIPLNYSETPTFSDVLRVNPLTNGLYDYMHIETAAKAGIIRGNGGGRFEPNATITREDAAVMIARAANLQLSNNTQRVITQLQKQFTDANAISVYAAPAVEAVVDAEFIMGRENVLLAGEETTFRFDPKASFTRAEAATVAYRVMADQDLIPN